MIRGYIIGEGQTEETFVRDVIAPDLAYKQIFLTPRLIPTSPGNKGGALKYQRIKHFIINCLKEDTDTILTTFFDLYALDQAFPEFEESKKLNDVYQRVKYLEQAFKADIANENAMYANRFLPYIQPYEFEGLLFTDIAKLIELEEPWHKSHQILLDVRNLFESPEHINDSYENKPSSRLINNLKIINYRKTRHGVLAIQSIGIDKLCAECKHFSEWYTSLSQLGNVCR
jgi:hypothetical protein